MNERCRNSEFFTKLLASFASEINHCLVRNANLIQLQQKLDEIRKKADNQVDLVFHWHEIYQDYLELNREKAALLNINSRVSKDYPSMEAFWEDADQQAHGLSQFTYWDTYEHGRRRQLESMLAKSYGSSEAILVNSGMGAVCSVLESLNLKQNDILITSNKNYFETYDYLEQYVRNKGVNVIRVENADLVETIKKSSPRAILVETVGNHPDVPVFEQWKAVIHAYKDVIFVIDNSVQSHLTPWYSETYKAPDNVVVVESATKYITEECVAGVIYGNGPLMDTIRHYARTIGINLQEKCFNYLSEGLIEYAHLKLALHSRNTQFFIDILTSKTHGKLEFLRSLNYHASSSDIFSQGQGCLVFLKHRSSPHDDPYRHRNILAAWKSSCDDLGLPIRAGFGWSSTTARAYESTQLNQIDAPTYLRISVGIEPVESIERYANLLANAIMAV